MDAPAPQPAPDATEIPKGVPVSVLIVFGTSLAALVVVGVIALLAARPPKPYPASTPDEMLDSMAAMVTAGEPGRLPELVEVAPPWDETTDRERMADLYIRLGRVLDAAGTLAQTASESFEPQVAVLEEELERGEVPSLLGSIMQSSRSRGEFSLGFGRGPQGRERAARALAALLIDPYRQLAEGRDRITTSEIDPDTAAILWDGRPAIPPFGLLIRKQDDGVWKLVPPLQMPMVQRMLPKTESEYQIWGSLLATLENLLIDLESQVRSGRIKSLEALSNKAVESAIVPMGMVMMAYANAVEERDEGP
ncbi:MAG: hypothetical protein RIB32_00645 [Phycisphaerales bacterium]